MSSRSAALAAAGLALACAPAAAAAAPPIAINVSALAQSFEGIGALSGGGGVTRLLIDYPPEIREDIWDILFAPKKGASLQMIKVEIGGDTQSTEGTESSHMHTRDDLNCTRGYEWTVLEAAKARNPDIRTFGLTWGVPGWMSSFYSDDNIEYHTNWLQCAADFHAIDIDFLGIWNERGPDASWTKALRAALDAGGWHGTRLVYADTDWSVAAGVAADPALAAAVDVIGAHYPGAPSAAAYALNKTLWASEMWNLGKVNDWDGAAQLAHDLNQHAQWGLSSSIIWCLIFSWYAMLPFSRPTATNAGLGHALLVAAEPWSGNYIISPTIHVVAHHTQFAAPGWTYVAGAGMGALPGGGTYVTRVNTHVPAAALELSITIDVMGVAVPQAAAFSLAGLSPGRALPAALHVWTTTQAAPFAQQADVPVAPDGSFTLALPADAMVTVTTTVGQSAPAPRAPVPPSAPFPFPYADNFTGYALGAYARYFCDEGGVFVVDALPAGAYTRAPRAAGAPAAAAAATAVPGGTPAYHNVVDVVPIVWETNPLPYTLIGNENGGPGQGAWTDYSVTVSAALDPASAPGPPPGPELRATQDACGTASAAWTVRAGSLAAGAQLESAAHAGLCLAAATSNDPGYPSPEVVVDACAGNGRAWWTARASMQVYNNATDACLDELSSSKAPDDDLIAFPCKAPGDPSGNANQQWTARPSPLGGGAVELVSANSGLCVTAAGAVAPGGGAPYVMAALRINNYVRGGAPVQGYALYVYASPAPGAGGAWALRFGSTTLANGTTAAPILPGVFHELSVAAVGTRVTAALDGAALASVTDAKSAFGMAAMGSSWTKSWFMDFAVANVTAAWPAAGGRV